MVCAWCNLVSLERLGNGEEIMLFKEIDADKILQLETHIREQDAELTSLREQVATEKYLRELRETDVLDAYDQVRFLNDRVRELEAAAQDLYDNIGGHNHWDAQGNHGATCPVCIQQREAKARFREALAAHPAPKETK